MSPTNLLRTLSVLALGIGLANGNVLAQMQILGEEAVDARGADQFAALAMEEGAGEELRSDDGENCYDADGVLDIINPINISAKVGVVGMGLYTAAGVEMRRRNWSTHPRRPARRLNAREKAALRPEFGGLVDNVWITYNALLMTQVPVEVPVTPFGPSIRVATLTLDDSTIGQTFGHDIYIRSADPGNNQTRDDPHLLIHELQHSRQFDHLHQVWANFGYYYFYNWALAGYDYASNCMEQEAEGTANRAIAACWQRYQNAGP